MALLKSKHGKYPKSDRSFSMGNALYNVDVNEKVNLSNKTIKSIIENYIGHETITCDDRDLPLKNKYIKELIHEKNQYYKPYH